MRLHDMKCTKSEKDQMEPAEVAVEVSGKEPKGPRYPYGLTLHLGPESLNKLGIDASSFKAGDTVKVAARAKVERVVQVDQESDDVFSGDSVELQITNLGVHNREDFDAAWDEATED